MDAHLGAQQKFVHINNFNILSLVFNFASYHLDHDLSMKWFQSSSLDFVVKAKHLIETSTYTLSLYPLEEKAINMWIVGWKFDSKVLPSILKFVVKK